MDVSYITVKANKLTTVPIVNGQLIALSDKDALFYDMEGTRRSVSGQKVVSELPVNADSSYADTLYIVTSGQNKGIHLWTGSQFVMIAAANTDENVKTIVSKLGKSYIVGAESATDATSSLKKHDKVYIDNATGKIYAEGFAGGPADTARSAETADTAARATADENNQNIAQTYMKSIDIVGTEVKVTYGDNTTKVTSTQDTNTHYKTNVVVASSADAQKNSVATNGQVHLNISDDNMLRSSHLIKGEGSVQVTSDAQGNISISSEDTWKPNTANQAGYVAAGEPESVWGTDAEGNPSWVDAQSIYNHPNSGVTPGSYTKVTVNAQGHVTSGTNPDTLSDYGIKDGVLYKVLDNTDDLNRIWAPGLYTGQAGNSIANKPSDVDGFGLLVIPGESEADGIQKLFDWSDEKHQFTRYEEANEIGEWSEDKLTDTLYEHPTGPGYNHIPDGGSTGQVLVWDEEGQATWGTPESVAMKVMKGSTEDASGESGAVPTPPPGPAEAYLRNDGTWSVPPDTKYLNMVGATSSTDGQSGLVPAPAKSNVVTFLGSDGQWHIIDLSAVKPSWTEYIPE